MRLPYKSIHSNLCTTTVGGLIALIFTLILEGPSGSNFKLFLGIAVVLAIVAIAFGILWYLDFKNMRDAARPYRR